MKKFLAVVLSVLLFAAVFAFPAYADGEDPTPAVFSVETKSSMPGQKVTVTVSVESELAMNGLTLFIHYDPSLTFFDRTIAPYVSNLLSEDDMCICQWQPNNPTVSLGLLFVSNSVVLSGDLVTLTFIVPESANNGDILPLTLEVGDYYYAPLNSGSNDKIDLPSTAVNGSINVFEVAKHTVTFMDGSNVLSSVELYDGLTVARPDDPVNAGFDFGGWLLDGGIYDFDAPVLRDITLTASWVEQGSITYIGWNDYKYVPGSKPVNDVTALVSGDTNELSAGWYIAVGNVQLTERVVLSGDVNIILADECILYIPKGISVVGSSSLSIYAQSFGTTAGSLVIDDCEDYLAGIGGDDNIYSSSVISIYGGTISAIGGSGGAGIGGGDEGDGGIINIYGGSVSAKGGSNASGIGGGSAGDGGTINICGGVIDAKAGKKGYGIGFGKNGSDAEINLSWTTQNDNVTSASYAGTVSIVKPFMLSGTTTIATAENISAKTIVPARYPHALGDHVELRTRGAKDTKSDLRFVIRVNFNDSYIKYNGNNVGPALDGYKIKKIMVDLYVGTTDKVATVKVTNIWDMQANAAEPHFLFTVVVTEIPEGSSDTDINLLTNITVSCGSYTDTVVGTFIGSVDDVGGVN